MFGLKRLYEATLAAVDGERSERRATAKLYAEAIAKVASEQRAREEIQRAKQQTDAVCGFLCARVNQLEVERALLLRAVLRNQVDFPIPSFTAAVPIDQRVDEALSATLPPDIFSDMGDAEAKRRGVSWDSQGRVEYKPPAETP